MKLAYKLLPKIRKPMSILPTLVLLPASPLYKDSYAANRVIPGSFGQDRTHPCSYPLRSGCPIDLSRSDQILTLRTSLDRGGYGSKSYGC